MLQLQNLSLQTNRKILLDNCSLTLYPGMKIGVVGRNGCGKTTFFNAINGTVEPHSGNILLPKKISIGMIAQETPGLTISALEYVTQGDQLWYQTTQQLQLAEQQQDHNAIAQLHMLLADLDGYTIHARASKILAGLGILESKQNNTVASFSGGWRIRLNIARCLLTPADLLLLDEPTNHLDLTTISWLEKWLLNYSGCLLIISHDREFLDTVTSTIIHFDKQQLKLYKGNYSSFEEQRQALLNYQEAAYKKQQEHINHMLQFVTRFKAKATKAKQAQSRLKAIEKLEKIAKNQVDLPFSFGFLPAEKQPTPMIKLVKVSAGYFAEQIILKKINLQISPGNRIGLIGKNGEGKSTLIKTLAGTLPAITGEATIYNGVKIGYFAQHNIDHLDLTVTPLTLLATLAPTTPENNLRSFLAGFAFDADLLKTTIKNLSGGEKSRLALALIIWQKPNLLLLDEPTNHLDLAMRSALTLALQNFSGAMVLVSHDRHLLKTTVDKLYLIAQQTVTEYPGDVNDYLAEP